jgi:hypothetical protein
LLDDSYIDLGKDAQYQILVGYAEEVEQSYSINPIELSDEQGS